MPSTKRNYSSSDVPLRRSSPRLSHKQSSTNKNATGNATGNPLARASKSSSQQSKVPTHVKPSTTGRKDTQNKNTMSGKGENSAAARMDDRVLMDDHRMKLNFDADGNSDLDSFVLTVGDFNDMSNKKKEGVHWNIRR
jgi:hypothetical protein